MKHKLNTNVKKSVFHRCFIRGSILRYARCNWSNGVADNASMPSLCIAHEAEVTASVDGDSLNWAFISLRSSAAILSFELSSIALSSC